MKNSIGSFCDGHFIDLCINTQLELPSERDTILTFFERLQKQFPELDSFSRRDSGEYVLENQQEGQRSRWVSLDIDRIYAGCADPEDFEDAYKLHRAVLDLIPYMLGVSPLDIDSMDVTYAMDFDFQGNHDEVIAEAIMANSSFGPLFDIPNARTVGCCPSVIIALDKECRLQGRIAVESRTTVFDVRHRKYKEDDPISLYFTMRRYPKNNLVFKPIEAFDEQTRVAEEMMYEKIIPHFAKPLSSAIAHRR